MNQPSQESYYLMAVAAAVDRVGQMFARNPRRVRLEDYRIQFGARRAKAAPAGRGQSAAARQAIWLGMAARGGKIRDAATGEMLSVGEIMARRAGG